MKVYHMEQMSAEWYAAKCGIPSASKADKMLTPLGKLSAQSDTYMDQLLAERAGFADDPMEPTDWMKRGIKLEDDARKLFAFTKDIKVKEVGWVTNDEGTAGCSPDGVIKLRKAKAGWENKCPKASIHIGYLRRGELPKKYKPQVHMSMAILGVKDWFFQSYFPGLDPLIIHVEADDYTAKIAEAVSQFTKNLQAEAKRLGIA